MRDNEIFDSAKEADEIAESFAKIVKIIREEILPLDYKKPESVWDNLEDDGEEVGIVSLL